MNAIVVALFVATCGLFVWHAWIGDDAYISFRTIDNFVHGRGLTWNIAERVQAYTHPLWVLCLSVFCFFTDEYFLTPILLSLALSIAAVFVTIRVQGASAYSTSAVLLALGLSASFVSYTTSGLENPLTFFLLSLYLAAWGSKLPSARRLFLAGLVGSLATVNRLDNVFIFGIPLLYEFWREKDRKARRAAILGWTPLGAWLLFSLVYYGTWVPNSAYAKLFTGIPRLQYIRQGLLYFWDALLFEPITLIGVILGVLAAFRGRSRAFVPLGVGTLAFLLYVVWVGGDFMRGRFLTVPFLLGMAVLLRQDFCVSPRFRRYAPLVIVALALPSIDRAILAKPWDESRQNREGDATGIVDERWVYSSTGSAFRAVGDKIGHDMGKLRQIRATDPSKIRIVSSSGRCGFASRPEKYIVDSYALTNPLLSRLEVPDPRTWRIGHFERRVPEGYMTALVTGDHTLADPEIGDLYRRIESVARGRLFSAERWKNIWRLNNPFATRVYRLRQEESISPGECARLASTHLEVLDSQLLWGAARVRLMEGDERSTAAILERLFWLESRRRGLPRRVDYVREVVDAARVLRTSYPEKAKLLLAVTAREMPHRKELSSALAEIDGSVNED